MTQNSSLPITDKLLAWIVSWLGWIILQSIGKTSRLRVLRHPRCEEWLASGKPCVFAFWHRYQLLMAYEHRHRGVSVLVSQSKDGELIAQTLHRFGFSTVRGSSSRGGGPALSKTIDLLKDGKCVAFTPDGPRGPFRSVQPGVAAAAQKAGVPIVPLAWAGSGVKELSSWDRFLIPLPFSRFVVFFGEPFFVREGESDVEGRIQKALDSAVLEAERLLAS